MVAIFTAEIRCMMYVFGDVETPCSETAERIENLIRHEIRKLLIETNAGEPSISDILFTLRSGSQTLHCLRNFGLNWNPPRRSQKNLLLRIVRFMHALDTGGRGLAKILIRRLIFVPDKVCKMTRVDEVLESIAVWDFKNSIQKELRRYPHNDPLKLAKLKVMSDRINSLSDHEYEHHVYCQRASFYGYATKQRSLVKMQADTTESSNFPLKNQKMEKYGFVKRKGKMP